MGVDTEHEEECKVMRIPENFESLLPDFVVGRSVHQDHDEEHKVTGDATWLGIMNLLGGLLSNF